MIFTMTSQVTPSFKIALVIESQDAASGRCNIICIEINKVAVVGGITLQTADTMRIMTGITGCFYIIYMFFVIFERSVIINGTAGVAIETQLEI